MTANHLEIAPMTGPDLAEVLAIQQANPAAAQWDPQDYLRYEAYVARADGRIVGFLVARESVPDEREVLNLAVDPASKRSGVGRRLLSRVSPPPGGALFLEVRESNEAARAFYKAIGFMEIGIRTNYYNYPKESGIVMKLQK